MDTTWPPCKQQQPGSVWPALARLYARLPLFRVRGRSVRLADTSTSGVTSRPLIRELPSARILALRAFALRAISVRALGFPVLAIYGLAVDPTTGSGGVPCLWRLVFGVECPGCGLSRADALLFRGHVRDAVAMNWLIVPVVLMALCCFAAEAVNHVRYRRKSWPN